MFDLHIDSLAEEELSESAEWYTLRNEKIGREFFEEVYRMMENILFHPLLYQQVTEKLHRAHLRRFPFSLFYYIIADRIVIIACLHDSRNIDSILKARHH